MKKSVRLAALVLLVGACATGCPSKVWYVKPLGSGDGTSWNKAFASIQDAVDAASKKGGEVWVAGGLYAGERGEARTGVLKTHETSKAVPDNTTVEMKQGVHLYGGFAGTETSRDARDWEGNLTVIDGGNTRVCVLGANDATLDGFTVRGGYGERGGGMVNLQTSPMVRHCIFDGNTVVGQDAFGGGMYNEGASPAVDDCTFKTNTARTGAGMYNGESSTPEVTGCTFLENAASTGGGGAAFNASSSAVFANCTFIKNTSGMAGGAIYNRDSSPRCSNGVFFRNSAGAGGAGAWNEDSFPTFTNCTFSQNASGASGGGIGNASSSPIVTNCILWHDSASESGAELYNDETSSSTVTYSCVEGGSTAAGNIAFDPLLIGTLGSKGRIAPASRCIDAGIPAGAAATDIRGVARPQGKSVDIGAYELDDSDGDTISDAWERTEFGSLAIASASTDADADGVKDLQESLYDSDPKLADTDDDDTSDRDEILLGREPTIRPIVRYANAANSSGVQDGLSWASGYTSLQTAVDDLEGCDEGEIWAAAGTYTGEGDNVVAMKANIYLYGGFAGAEFRQTARDWEANVTVIDGEGVRRCVYGADHAGLDGFTVRSGFAAGAGMYNVSVSPRVAHCVFSGNTADTVNGGGMSNEDASPTVVDCIFGENTSALSHGAGMYNHGGAPKVDHCEFNNNVAQGVAHNRMADAHGGGMYNEAASPVVTNCTFNGNNLTNGDGAGMYNTGGSLTITGCVFDSNACEGNTTPSANIARGGGICNVSCDVTVADCTFNANAARYGGAIYNGSASSTVTRCVFTGNRARGAYTSTGGGMCNDASSPVVTQCTFTSNDASGLYFGNGGGMYSTSGSPVVTDCTFDTNHAAGGGGGMYNGSAPATVTNCFFTGNIVTGWHEGFGGGMYNGSCAPAITNCVFAGNIAHQTDTCRGGAIYNEAAWANLMNCTLSGNSADGRSTTGAGGIYNQDCAPSISNCILWGDSPGEIQGTYTGVFHSCVQGGNTAGLDNIEDDPLFVDPANGDYSLQASSPCIDKGTDVEAPGMDILGVARPQGLGFDMGAYEYAAR